MNDLVRHLSTGDHPVEASMGSEKTIERFKAAIDNGYVHIRFTGTRGGTDLGFKLDQERSNLAGADFAGKTGVVRLCGELTLDYEKVRCIADINLATLDGTGHLELLPRQVVS